MDDATAIAIAKSDYRDAYNNGDVDGVLSFFAEGFTDFTAGTPSFFGQEARLSLRQRIERLFRDYTVRFVPVINNIVVLGDMAYDYGWHKSWLESKSGGQIVLNRERYIEIWRRGNDGQWKITLLMTNKEFPPEMLPT